MNRRILALAAALALSGCSIAPFGQTHVALETELCGAPVSLEYASGQDRKTARVEADCEAKTFVLETTETTGVEAQKEALSTVRDLGETVRAIVPLWTGPLGAVEGLE